MKRKPIPLYMLDVLNAYQASGRIVRVYPYAGQMSINGCAAVPYAVAYDQMRECIAREAR